MAISTYNQLGVAVARWVGGSDASDSTALGFPLAIADVITIAEARIFREARTKDTEASMTTTISSGVVAVPSDYIALKFAYIDATPVQTLERRSAEWIYSNYSTRTASGMPKYIGRDASNFIFGPYPDSGYTVKGVYYKKLAALSTTAHALFTNNPDLYLFGCLAEAELIVGKDARVQVWEAKYQKILADVNGVDRAEGSSGGALQMRVG